MNIDEKNINLTVDEDISLIQACLEHDRDAFNKLVLKYNDMVFNLCFRMMGDYDEANDCAQDAFLKVYHNLHKFKQKSAFSTWLYRIAVNTCKNSLASSHSRISKRMFRLNGNSSDKDKTDNIDIQDSSMSPDRLYERSEDEKKIQDALDSLPSEFKVLVILKDIEGRSYDEISEITGIKAGTVKSRLSRARQQLRDILRGTI